MADECYLSDLLAVEQKIGAPRRILSMGRHEAAFLRHSIAKRHRPAAGSGLGCVQTRDWHANKDHGLLSPG